MLFECLKFEILFSIFDISAEFVEYQGKYSRIFFVHLECHNVLFYTYSMISPTVCYRLEVNKGIYFSYPSRRHSCALVNNPTPCVNKMIAHIEDVDSKIQEHLKQVGDLLKSGGLIIYISRSY